MVTGRVVSVLPGRSVVRLLTGQLVVARNGLNSRTPLRSLVVAVETQSGWVVVGRRR